MASYSYDSDYVDKSLRITSVNIPKNDFYATNRKNEIREIFRRLFIKEQKSLPPWNWNKVALNRVTKDQINNSINVLKRYTDSTDFDLMYRYPFKGPGEVMLYLIINDARLMPDKDAEVDMTVGSDKYQVKSYKTSEDAVKDLRISGIEMSDTASRLMALKESVGLPKDKGVSKTQIDIIKKIKLEEFNAIENDFRKDIYENYFKKVEFIFLDATTKTVKAIKNVQKEDITIQRYESGIIRPTIKISDTQIIE